SRRRHTRCLSDWSSDVCSSDLVLGKLLTPALLPESVRAELAAKGHQLDLRDARGVGSVKAIMIHPRSGALLGGVSPTGDSYVMRSEERRVGKEGGWPWVARAER